MTTTIYLMRHGQVHNPKDILYGRLPRFHLSQEGERKVSMQALRLKMEKLDAIYCSPLFRTRQTAGIIAKVVGIKPKISSLITEVRLIIQGMPLSVFRKTIQPDIYDKKYTDKGQEGAEEIITRMRKFMKMILKKHEGQRILVISHGDPIVILKSYLSGVPFTYKYKKDNYLTPGDYIKLIAKDGKYSLAV